MKRFLLPLILLVPASAAAEGASNQAYQLIDQRLELMQPVAAWKLDRGVAVEDKEREAVVLAKAVEAAGERGIDPEGAAAFFAAQIEAAKEIQFCWLERWDSGAATPPTEVPDLKADIRPQLIQIGADLLTSVQEGLSQKETLHLAAFQDTVEVDCLSAETRDGLFDALTQLELSD